MRVGIDARKLRDGGIGTYIRSLLREFAREPGGNDYVALAAPEDLAAVAALAVGADAAAGGRVVEARPVRAGKYSLAEHLAVPVAARSAAVELLHAPHFTLPFLWRGPSVVTIHDLIHVRHAHLFRPGTGLAARTIAGAAARRARLVLTGSTHARNEIAELLGVPPGKIRITPYGVSGGIGRRADAEVAPFLEARGLPPAYVLYVGARKAHKNVGVLLRALGLIPAGARPPLVLSGPPWAAGDPLAEDARAAGVLDSIHFAGDLEGDGDLSRLYSGALLYAQPSRDEGFGLPPLEAMACGVPVVSSPAGALAETLGDAAMFVPPDDVEGWAAAIAALLGDPARRRALAEQGLAHARRFTWARTAELTRDAYAEAMRNG